MNKKRAFSQGVLWVVFILVILINIFPLVWMISTSLKSNGEIFSSEIHIIPHQPTISSYTTVFKDYPITTWYKNSFLSTVGVTALQIIVSLAAAFGISYFRTKWNNVAFYFLIVTMVIPFQVTMIPNYITVSKLGLKDTLSAVILPYAANATTFFYLYQNLKTIPRAYFEVADIEGASVLWSFWHVACGLSKGAISAIIILTVIDSWNLYFWPLLVLTKAGTHTLTIAIQEFQDFEMGSRWGPSMAVATLASIPVVVAYLFFQRNIINAFISAGLKG